MSQQQVQKSHARKAERTEEETPNVPEQPEADALKAHSDDLLDEIDKVLEENAAEFVANYKQKGGE